MSDFEVPAESHWHRMISEAAYYLAQKRGFRPGNALDDWLEAETFIKTTLTGEELPASLAPRP